MKQMKTHWAADIFALNESDVEALAEDIKKNGQMTPIKALKDGSIVDGRNRFLACQKAGVDPVVEIINPDGEEMTDDTLCSIVISCNSMRRDETTSKRACAAAEMWKRLYPEGAPKSGRPKAGEVRGESHLTYEKFAKANFKAGMDTAKRALAILNHSPDLMDKAKTSLSDAYEQYLARVKSEKEEARQMKMLEADENADMKERVDSGGLNLKEAIKLIYDRDEEAKRRNEETERRIDSTISTLKTISHLSRFDSDEIQEAFSRISDDNFAEGYASGISILAQLK